MRCILRSAPLIDVSWACSEIARTRRLTRKEMRKCKGPEGGEREALEHIVVSIALRPMSGEDCILNT